MSRILIDGRFVGVGESISRYTLEIVKGILESDKENEYTLLVRPQGKPEVASYKLKDHKNFKLKVLDIPHYSLSEQTKLLKYLNEEKFDLVHFTQFNHPIRYKGNYVVTIHDLTMVGHLHRNLPHKRIAFGLAMKSAVKDSIKIIAISNTTKKDILEYYKNTPKDKFEVIYHGIDHKNYNLNVKGQTDKIKEFKKKYDISDEYILYTGMWKKHKNILRMFSAFEKFKAGDVNSNVQLVLVGKIDKREPEVIKEVERINNLAVQYNNKPIVLTGFILEEELPIAYAGAFAYCIPSLSEGFGWPPLEAMACGTPVIASKESSIPEICGDAPLYFDAYDVEDIAKKMKTITTDTELRKQLIKKGLAQVEKYNWGECAEKTYAVYKRILKQN